MISGKEIIRQVENGNITIEPFDSKQAGPNSYDLRLSNLLAEVIANSTERFGTGMIDTHEPSRIKYQKMLDSGAFVLIPGKMYLGSTMESMGSKHFVPVLHGRSSAARHGLMVHLCAGFADVGWYGQWVLEIVNLTPYPMLVWPGDRVCQVSFERLEGEAELYQSTYQNQTGIVPGKGLGDE